MIAQFRAGPRRAGRAGCSSTTWVPPIRSRTCSGTLSIPSIRATTRSRARFRGRHSRGLHRARRHGRLHARAHAAEYHAGRDVGPRLHQLAPELQPQHLALAERLPRRSAIRRPPSPPSSSATSSGARRRPTASASTASTSTARAREERRRARGERLSSDARDRRQAARRDRPQDRTAGDHPRLLCARRPTPTVAIATSAPTRRRLRQGDARLRAIRLWASSRPRSSPTTSTTGRETT